LLRRSTEAFGEIGVALSKTDGCVVVIDLGAQAMTAPEISAEKAKWKKRSPARPRGGESNAARRPRAAARRAGVDQPSELRHALLLLLLPCATRSDISCWSNDFPVEDQDLRRGLLLVRMERVSKKIALLEERFRTLPDFDIL
jgi:hypothetical protein